MAPQQTRAATTVLSLLEGFIEVPDALVHAATLLGAFDRAGWLSDGYNMEETPQGDETTLKFASLPPPATLLLPGLPLTAQIGLKSQDGLSVLRVLRETNGTYLEIGDLSATIEFDTSLLRPVDPAQSSVQIDATLAVRVKPDGAVEFVPRATMSLPFCRVAGLPVEVKLDNLQFDLRSDLSPPEITALGFDSAFVGVYAETAILRLLPELNFGAVSGIELQASALALGKTGFSANLGYHYDLLHDGQVIDPTSDLQATIIQGVRVGLSDIEVSVRHSLPESFSVRGVLQLPLLSSLLGVDFSLRPRPTGASLRAVIESLAPVAIDLGPAVQVDIARLRLQGDVDADRLSLLGQFEQITARVGAVNVSLASADLRINHTANVSELTAALGNVDLGPLGNVSNVSLLLRETTGGDGTISREGSLVAQIEWRDVRDRVNVPPSLPLPPDDATVSVKVSAQDDGAGNVDTRLELSVAATELDFGDWLPPALRFEVRDPSLALSISYAGNHFNSADSSAAIAVTASGAMQIRLPALSFGLPDDLLHVTTGDVDGWLKVAFNAGVTSAGEPSFDASISDPLSIEVQVPGLTQPQAPVIASIDSLTMEIRSGAVTEGEVVLKGRLELRPILPPRTIPIAMHVEQMFAAVGLTQVAGDCDLALRFKDDKLQVALEAVFEDTSVSVDLFGVVANLASGLGAQSTSDAVPLSLEASISLTSVSISLGSLDPAETGMPFVFEVVATASIAGMAADCVFSFSNEEIVIGIRGHEVSPGRWNTDIPLSLPRFPVTTADLDLMRANAWDADAYRTQRAQQLASSLGVPDITGNAPRIAKARRELEAATFLLRQVANLRGTLDPSARDTFTELWIRNFVGALEALTGWLDTGSDVRLRLQQFALTLPLSDPRNLGVEGTLSIVGFAPGDPFEGLNGTKLSAGISADLIYFALDGTGDPIELPSIGRYSGGTVSLGQLRIGYGYTSNSFNVVVDGAFVPPPALVADLDTSEELGIGVRLPSRNALYFRLGLIPIPGPIPVMPVFDFDLDLRSPNSQPLVDADRAIPFWDGLQFIAEGVFRVDLKHLAFSPMLGPLPIPNLKYDGDWMIGNDDLGFTVIADNVHVMAGLSTTPPTPIPFLADPAAPYFDNLVLNLRIAGFKLNLNMQHPFPSFNPLAVLELFSLLSDPLAPVDRNGPLANILRVTLKNVHIELPQWARQLFPDSDALVQKPGDFTLNVGTALSALQALLTVGKTTLDVATEAGSSLRHAIDRLPEVVVPDVDAILSALPPELRKLRLGGSLSGFEARAVVMLISPDAASQALRDRDAPSAANVTSAPRWGDATPRNSASAVPVPLGRRGQRESFPSDPSENLFRGLEFASFSSADLDDVIGGDAAAIVIAAHIKVFESQRYRFLGAVSSDGTFLLVTTAEVRPLLLHVAGIDIRLPFEAAARMRLEGRARRDGFHGSITARGYADWQPIPYVLSLSIGSKEKPVALALYSNGSFRARGAMHLQLFAAALDGEIDVSNTHCFVSGGFNFTAGSVRVAGERKTLIALDVEAEGRVGPGAAFRIAGSGSLRILDQPFSNVSAVITDHSAQVSASLNTKRVSDLTGFPMAISGELSGAIDLRRANRPSFSLAGRIDAQVFDFAIHGAGLIASQAGKGVRVRAEGSLYWGGHEWLGGFLDVGTRGLKAGGRTRFAFPLTHPGTGNAQFASLYCEVHLGGRFDIDLDKALASWHADASCLIGLQLPSKQFVPLASFNAKGHGQTSMRLDILNFHGFEVPGMPEIEVEVPKVTSNGSIDVNAIDVGIPRLLDIWVPYMEGTPGPKPEDWVGFIEKRNLLEIPLLKLDGTETLNLSKLIANNTKVYVTFEDGNLVLKVESGGETVPIVLVENPT